MTAAPVVAGRRRPGLARLYPEPGRLWIAYAPRVWPALDGPWTDLAAGCLRSIRDAGQNPSPSELPAIDGNDLDDLFYLPPA